MNLPLNILADADALLYLLFVLVFSVIGAVMDKLKKAAEQKRNADVPRPNVPQGPRPPVPRPVRPRSSRPPVTSLPRPIIIEDGPRPTVVPPAPAAMERQQQPMAQRPRRPERRSRQPRRPPVPVAPEPQGRRSLGAMTTVESTLRPSVELSGLAAEASSDITSRPLEPSPRPAHALSPVTPASPQDLRRAIVFAELLAPPVALREPATTGLAGL